MALVSKPISIVVLIISITLSQGCVMSTDPVPEDLYYRLQADTILDPLPNPKFSGSIEVERFVADGVTAGRPIVYSEAGKPNQLKEYHYHFWTEPPTIMLRDELVNYLRDSNIADAVVTPEMRVRSAFILTGKIQRLERVIGEKASAKLALQLSLRRSETGELILLRVYKYDVPSDEASISGAVRSLNSALSNVYAEFLEDLKEY